VKIHEYQAKEMMRKYGIPVPNGKVVSQPEKVRAIFKELGGEMCVVKAQIHAGGRGKGRFREKPDLGGVKLAWSPEDAERYTRDMLGHTLVTHQTGDAGKKVTRVLIEEGLNIKRELYLGMVIDRERSKIVIMASTEGGMEIEKVAAETPEKIIKVWVDPAIGLMSYQISKVSFGLGLSGAEVKANRKFLVGLYNLFTKEDASLAEINPLVVTGDGDIVALDAKINFDDNSTYRHTDHIDLRDFTEEDPLEVEASKYGFNYVKLHGGSVGCMVNGAGLAMATMDIIKLYGADPANFLDVGGAASSEVVENAFRILINDKDVKAVLINIFGGIVRCDVVATGIVEGLQKIGNIDVPVIVRLRGTNAEEGLKILKESSLEFTLASEFAEAAELAVKATKKGGA
jgi:succinyl-CoA synthetase beta subunit